jgi:hypothetical protein
MNRFSKKDHVLYTSPIKTVISLIDARAFYQYTILSSKVAKYLDENIAVTDT